MLCSNDPFVFKYAMPCDIVIKRYYFCCMFPLKFGKRYWDLLFEIPKKCNVHAKYQPYS